MRSWRSFANICLFFSCFSSLFGFPSIEQHAQKREANFLLPFAVAPKSYNLKISTHCHKTCKQPHITSLNLIYIIENGNCVKI